MIVQGYGYRSEHFFPSITTVWPLGILTVSLSPRSVYSWMRSSGFWSAFDIIGMEFIGQEVRSNGMCSCNDLLKTSQRTGLVGWDRGKGVARRRRGEALTVSIILTLHSLHNILPQDLRYFFSVSDCRCERWI
jgi:hypothetical protein